MNAQCFAILTLIVLATGLGQPSASAQVLKYRHMPLLRIFGNVFVQSSRLNPSQPTDYSAQPPDTGTPDDRRTPGGSRIST